MNNNIIMFGYYRRPDIGCFSGTRGSRLLNNKSRVLSSKKVRACNKSKDGRWWRQNGSHAPSAIFLRHSSSNRRVPVRSFDHTWRI